MDLGRSTNKGTFMKKLTYLNFEEAQYKSLEIAQPTNIIECVIPTREIGEHLRNQNVGKLGDDGAESRDISSRDV